MTDDFDHIFFDDSPKDDYDKVVSKNHKELLSKIMKLFGLRTPEGLDPRLLSPNSLAKIINDNKTLNNIVPFEMKFISANYMRLHSPKFYSKKEIEKLLKINSNVIHTLDKETSSLFLSSLHKVINVTLKETQKLARELPSKYEMLYEIRAYKVRPRSIWWGKGAETVMKKFYRQLRLYRWQEEGMFHITLEVDPELYNLKEANKVISKQLNVLLKDLERGKNALTIRRRQAIKEWNPDNSYPYLNLFIEIEKTRVSVKGLVQKYWKIGDSKTKRIKDEYEFDQALHDCILVESIPKSLCKMDEKHARQVLPFAFRNEKYIARVFYPQKNPSRSFKFHEYKKFNKQLEIEGIETFKKNFKKKEPRDAYDYHPTKEKPADPDLKLKPKEPRDRLSYQQRLEIDRSTISFKPKYSKYRQPIWAEFETPFRYISSIPGDYNHEKAYVLSLNKKGLEKLFEIERLAKALKALEKILKERIISEYDEKKVMRPNIKSRNKDSAELNDYYYMPDLTKNIFERFEDKDEVISLADWEF